MTQPNGTDKISVTTDSPVVNKKSKYNFAKDILRFNDFKKLQKVQEQEQDYEYASHSMADNKKDNESDYDYEHAVKITDPTEVGHTLVHPGGQDNLRRRKVKYHLGEGFPMSDLPNPDRTDRKGASYNPFRKQKTADDIKRINAAKEREAKQTGLYKKQSPAQRRETVKQYMDLVKHIGEEQIDEVSSDLVKKARDVAFAKGKDDQGHRFVKKAYEKGQKESDAMAKKLSEELDESASAGLAAKAQKSGVSLSTLKKVYARGVAAWNSGHRPGTTPQQWGMARVNSYITKGKGTYHGADKDLREEEELEEANLPEVPKDKESGLPKKYVAGLSSATAKARAAHWDKMDKKSDSDPSAYEPAPGDATAKTKESKHTKKYRAMFGEDMDEEIYEACWVGYKQVGIKKKGNKYVPNCVKESAVDVSEYEENWEEHIFADEEPSEEELDHYMNHISDDDIYDLYDEEELTVVDDETGEELQEDEEEKELEEETLMEVLSRIERMKAKFRIRRTKAKRERATKIALKRYSNTKTINKRSRRLAVKLMKKRLLRGRDPSKISVAEKERVEKVIQNRKQIINRLAMRLAPRVRKIEKSRLSHSKMTKGSGNVAF